MPDEQGRVYYRFRKNKVKLTFIHKVWCLYMEEVSDRRTQVFSESQRKEQKTTESSCEKLTKQCNQCVETIKTVKVCFMTNRQLLIFS